jgi:hypothetical protein
VHSPVDGGRVQGGASSGTLKICLIKTGGHQQKNNENDIFIAISKTKKFLKIFCAGICDF